MAFEALNHGGSLDVDLLVILNDNDIHLGRFGAFSNDCPASSTRTCARAARRCCAGCADVGSRLAARKST